MATNAAKRKADAEAKKAPVKKKPAPPTRAEMASALLEHVNTKMKGKAELVLASSLSLTYINKRVPTGLLSLDLALRGGFPCAGLSQVIGKRNAGKDYICWCAIRQLQQLLGDKLHVLLAMTEHRADRTQARLVGVQIALSDEDIAEQQRAREKNGWPPLTPEEIADMKKEVGVFHELHGMNAESLYDAVLRAVEMNVYHLIVINSIGNLMSEQEEQNESVADKTYGGIAGVNTTMIHKLSSMLMMKDEYGRERDTCVIVVNQVRDDIKNPKAPYKAAGGNALEHAKFVDLYIYSGSPVGQEEKIPNPAGGVSQRFIMSGKEVNWEIKKGKAGIHEGGRGIFVYDFKTNGANFYMDTIIAGLECGVISMAGAWLTLVDPENGQPFMEPDEIEVEVPIEGPKPGTKIVKRPNPRAGKELLKAQGRDAFCAALEQDARQRAADGTFEDSLMNLIRTLCFKVKGINITYEWAY